MKWCRRHADVPDDGADLTGAELERQAAERELKRVRAQRDEVSNVARKLRDIRHRNHFAEMIREALAERTDRPWTQ